MRVSDGTSIVRVIDLRQMTAENQHQLCEGIKRAATVSREEEWLARCLSEFADMVVRMERGEPPSSKSDFGPVGVPPNGERIGPGWT